MRKKQKKNERGKERKMNGIDDQGGPDCEPFDSLTSLRFTVIAEYLALLWHTFSQPRKLFQCCPFSAQNKNLRENIALLYLNTMLLLSRKKFAVASHLPPLSLRPAQNIIKI